MPVITRSSTGPTKKMVGVKRKFVEILDTDDETASVSSGSDSECQTDELYTREHEKDTLVNLIVEERKISDLLREEIAILKDNLESVQEHRTRLIESIKEYQRSALFEAVCFSTLLAITTGVSFAIVYMYNTEHL